VTEIIMERTVKERSLAMRIHRSLMQAATALLLATPLAAQSPDLELTCRPEHALPDQRRERPSDVRDHAPFATYYLFDNPQLFEVRVGLMNLGTTARALPETWVRSLHLRVWRDGVELEPDEIRIEPARLLRSSLSFFQAGKRIAHPEFRSNPTGPGPLPLTSYDDKRREEQRVEALPTSLATYQQAVAIFRLRAADGGLLPLGLYEVDVTDEASHERCSHRDLVVMRAAQSPLDTVDSYLVRSLALEADGKLDQATQEMARATEAAPDVLKGWVIRSGLALLQNDLAGQAEAASQLERLLARKAGGNSEEFEGILQNAREVVRNAPELRRKLAAKERAKP
jgi:hypothetical protein